MTADNTQQTIEELWEQRRKMEGQLPQHLVPGSEGQNEAGASQMADTQSVANSYVQYGNGSLWSSKPG